MTTIKDTIEKLQSVTKDLEYIQKNLTFDVKAGSVNIDDPYRFVPKLREKYWFINQHGVLDYYYYRNDNTDKYLILTGNCYRTKEQAKRALEIINRIGELRGDWLPDWEDRNHCKYFPYKNHNRGQWKVGCRHRYCEGRGINMPTEQSAQTLIDEYGDDLLLVMRRL